uniref:NADH dehydrogenase subunit 6 n=1 Tax=Mastigeulota kiangsinensis TaxID=1544384 RepID=A0A0U1XAK2_MASKI|nr:NADH dehydrogenase subunit 6 [Mastigeulota kiangsinensis]AIN75489.1 NADH dehydrogenase subunit 6 [Mastigeulota kiangsinensis]
MSVVSVIYYSGILLLIWYLLLIMCTMSTPSGLMLVFLGLVVSSVYGLFLYVGDIFSYLLFMVYVGGLLVLLIYLIMLSSNYFTSYSGVAQMLLFGLMMIMGYAWMSSYIPLNISTMNKSMEFSGLIVLGGLLTFVFIYICNIVGVGGSSINIGKVS